MSFYDDMRKRQYEERRDIVALKAFEGEDLEYHIRALNAEDLARVENEASLSKSVSSIVDVAAAAIGGDEEARTQVVKELLGMGEKVPAQLIREYAIVQYGSIAPNEPKNRQDVVKFARVHPIEFKIIMRAILELTGKGAVAKKKPEASGAKEK